MPGHKFDPNKAAHLDSGLRNFFTPVEEILKVLEVKETDIWADIGCGPGVFTIPLAAVAKSVFALDISEKMLARLKEKVDRFGLENVVPKLSGESSFPLADASIDGLLLAFVAHEADNPELFFAEVARVLKKGGRLFVIEFMKGGRSFGPPQGHRLSAAQLDDWTARGNLRRRRQWRWQRSIFGWPYIDLVGYEYVKE